MDSPEPRPVLVSACLLGCACRYDGASNPRAELRERLAQRGETPIGFCPEESGGLGTPRPPAWMETDAADALDGRSRVVSVEGRDVTAAFVEGARRAAATCAEHGIERAYLKERSPSCGVRAAHVADPTHPGTSHAVEGRGVTAELLRRCGIETIGVE